VASPEWSTFAGGRINSLVLCEGEVGRTAESEETRFGLAQVRRIGTVARLRFAHVLFAPREPRPLLLGLVRLSNTTETPLLVEYTELWDVAEGTFRGYAGACERETPEGIRTLADAGVVLRTRVPEPPPVRGLALDLSLVLPPGAVRELSFAYAAPPPEESAARLVRAWRGEVGEALEGVVQFWRDRFGSSPDAVEAYRGAAAQGSS
jgi:hypothetical protein